MAGGPNPLLLASVLLASAVATALNLRGRRRSRGGLGTPLPSEGGCVYLDYAATCPIYPEVADAMVPFLYDHWGNPSSGHAYGAPCRSAVADARGSIARLLGCASEEVAFCSCGSEADNWAILASLGGKRRHVVVSAVEHPAILACVDALEREGGARGILVHTDAAQAVGKIDVNAKRLGVDYLTLVGHKFGAPKGVAALYHRRGAPLRSMLFGGGQEGGLRAGTEAVPSVVALGAAAAIWTREGAAIAAHSAAMRDRLRRRLEAALGPERCAVNGPLGAGGEALPNVLSFAVRGAAAASWRRRRPRGVASAACHSGSDAVSAVLLAVGVETELALGTLRLSVGRHTTAAVDAAADVLAAAILAADAKTHDGLNRRLGADATAPVAALKKRRGAEDPGVVAAEAAVRKAYAALRKLDKRATPEHADAALDAVDAAVAAAKRA
ncbi:cysteine desulfurase [Aureococcus anophagefferens]|nr:cysteine desulfurase [Aureococcus anophagefferens]